MKMKDVIEKTGLTDRAVRLYIENGLVAPSVNESYSGRRNIEFSDGDVEKLKSISVLRKAGFSIAQIKLMQQEPEKSKTVIVACFPYLLDDSVYKYRNISKYAVVTDYHKVAVERLTKAADMLREVYCENEFEVFADNSPIPEVRAACAAGLGVCGLNTLLITEKYGSYVFIGEIVTDLEIGAVAAEHKSCIGCGKCEKHCPHQIPIRQELKNVRKELEGPLYRMARKAVEVFKLY